MSNQDFMREAIALAIQNVAEGGGPFGCVIVKDGKVIARGVNRVTQTNDPTAHAEVVAIRNACHTLRSFQLTGCELYTSCEPCPMCMAAVYWARPDMVYFGATKDDAAHAGFDDSMIYEEFALPYEKRRIPVAQLGRDEALKALEAWAKTPDKVHY
jgi:tRNA(Arg) A34 adenosine deaminase TadA